MSKVFFKVDARSLRSFKKNVDISITGVAHCTKEEIVDFCELVLLDSTQDVPIDTGALAHSGDFKVTGSSKKGYKAKLGYAIGRRNPVNKRTGRRVSSYAGTVHESLQGTYNGRPKFFESALYKHESEFETKTGKSIKKYLSSRVVQPKEEPSDTNDKYEAQRENTLSVRMNQGFTADVDGKYLPFPVPHGMIYMRGGRYFLNRDFYKQQKDTRKKSVRKYKSTGKTAYQHRSQEIHRYTKAKAPTKKSTKRRRKTSTTAKKEVTKRVSKQRSTTSKVKSTRSSANVKTAKKTMQHSAVHEQAMDEFIQALIDGENKDDDK